MRLFEITFYSIDGGVMLAETNWIVEANDINDVMEKCNALSKKYKDGVFMPRAVSFLKLDDFNEEFVKSELEML